MTAEPLHDGDDDTEAETPDIRFVRVVRTPHSEQYILWEDETRLGQIDIHYNMDLINATLVVEKELDASRQNAIINQIDEEIITSYLPQFERENFLITIFHGRELEPYSDGEPDVEDEEEEY